MKKLIAVFMIGLVLPFTASAEKIPCWGEHGGISHCEGSKFVCNNGKYSNSKKICSGYVKKKHTSNKASDVLGVDTTNGKTDTKTEIKKNHTSNKPADILGIDITNKNTDPKTEITRSGNVLKLDYQGFTLWLDCEKRGVVKFQYKVQRGAGNGTRANGFKLDPSVPKECQQTSAEAYGQGYERGRLVPSNHLDYSFKAIEQSNYMTNILPQTSQMSQGAWLLTEEIIECYRDIDELSVMGGVIWGENRADDYFLKSHGVKTPDAYWKVVIRGTGKNEEAIAWVVPNSKDATQKHLDDYLVSLGELEIITGEKIPVTNTEKLDKPSASWIIPAGCKRG